MLQGGSARVKTYSASTGYVYEYRFAGMQHVHGTYEYLFARVTPKGPEILVRVGSHVIETWETLHGRELASSERYAAAKLALFRAMDEWPVPPAGVAIVTPDAAQVDEMLKSIGID